MAKTYPSGRFSRYPAVNRDTAPSQPVVAPAPAPAPAAEQGPKVADLTIDEVLAWVGNDPARAAEAKTQETAGKQRKRLLEALGKITG